MAENVKCRNCNRLKNHWCRAVIDSPDEDMIRDCRHFQQKTNADRIRSMSDEELAKILDPVRICATRTMNECMETYGRNCDACILDWLKQGVE